MRRVLLAVAAVATVAVTAVAVRGGAATPSARADSFKNGLLAYVVPTNAGPLPPCTSNPGDCTAANTVWDFVQIVNANRLTNLLHEPDRADLPNSYAVSSIDEQIFVDGVHQTQFDVTFSPPPNANYRSYSGRWPSAVTCPADGTPCNIVLNPAVLPGENTTILYPGWIHGSTEPNGMYVFRFTIHGTLNGNPLDLSASSPPIRMTG